MTDYTNKIRAAAERFNPLRPSDPMVRAAMAGAVIWPEEDVTEVQAAVADWYTDREDPEHTDHVHVNPNVVAEALQSQARARSASLDDLLAALDVDLLPWQRESLGRWVEHKLTFRMR